MKINLRTINKILDKIGLRVVMTIGNPPGSEPTSFELMTVRSYIRRYARKKNV